MKNNVLKRILLIFALVVAVLVAAVAIVWHGEIATLRTIHSVDGNKYLYAMEYKAAYDLDAVVEADIDSNAGLMEFIVRKLAKGIPVKIKNPAERVAVFNCTSFQVKNAEGEGYLYGRNYDFFKNPTMVTVSRPKNGYASIAVSDMSHFGYGLEKLPSSFVSKAHCLAAVYAPVDGINEKGLCTSIMALPKQPARQDSGKHKVGTTIIMRLFLDRCATVDEALELVDNLDICHDLKTGSGYHYMVADASGNCAVIEFDREEGWKTMVVRKGEGENSMLVTNHLLSPKYYTETPDEYVGNPHSRSWWRYETAGAYLEGKDGILSLGEAQECLSLVHWKDLVWDTGTVEDTQYSCVYDQKEMKLYIRDWSDWDTTHQFSLR